MRRVIGSTLPFSILWSVCFSPPLNLSFSLARVLSEWGLRYDFFFLFAIFVLLIWQRGSASLRRFLVTYCEISLSVRRRLRNYLFYENNIFMCVYEQISYEYEDWLASIITNIHVINLHVLREYLRRGAFFMIKFSGEVNFLSLFR